MMIGETIHHMRSNKWVMTCGGRDHMEKVPHDIISPMPVVLHWCVEIEVRDIGCDHVSIWGGVGTFKHTWQL